MSVGDFLCLLEQLLGEDQERPVAQEDLNNLADLVNASAPDLTKN